MHCMSNCPKKTIETGHGFILFISLLSSLVFTGLFYQYFKFLSFDIEHTFLGFILETALFLGILEIWHRLLHYAMRYKFVERIIVYTSLIKYKFWGHWYKTLKTNKNR